MFAEASKTSWFRTPFSNQQVNGLKTLLKSARHHYYSTFPRIWDKLKLKKSALVLSEIFRLFLNRFTPDDKYSHRNIENFW